MSADNAPPEALKSAGAKARPNDLPIRVASAAVMIVISVTAAWFGGVAWAVLAALVMAGVAYEWGRMISPNATLLWFRAFAAAICGVCFVMLPRAYEAVAAFGFFLTLFGWSKKAGFIAVIGTLYLAASGWALAGIRGSDEAGRTLLFGLFSICWATDSAAYAVGRAVGGPKLFPAISPNKTWSGSIGGTLAGIAAGIAYSQLSHTSLVSWAVIGWVLALACQGGDLLESLAKRYFGVKDASGVIPGHGGILDRLDGHLSAASALVFLILVIPGLKVALTCTPCAL
jgi:phosphatidate cytidylyltransferase